MQINDADWQAYQRVLQRSLAYLTGCNDINALLKICQQLTAQRLTLPDNNIDILAYYAELPPAVRQTELLLLFSHFYGWSDKVKSLMMLACFCSALAQTTPLAPQWPKLQRYPALLAARMLQGSGISVTVQSILAGAYPTERHIPAWQQNALSLILTQTEYLTVLPAGAEAISPAQQIGYRIAVTQSDYELKLLQCLLQELCQPMADRDSQTHLLLHQPQFATLSDSDNRQLEAYLRQEPEMAEAVLALASASNRQQQTITDVRLALSLLGQAQIPALLAQAELQSRLLQLNHPLTALYKQFSLVLAQALRLLLPNHFTAPSSQTLAQCLTAPLWLNDNSLTSGLVKRAVNGWQSALDIRCYHSAASSHLLNELLPRYQLTDWQLPAQRWLQNLQQDALPADNLTLILQLAWHSSLILMAPYSESSLLPLLSLAQRQRLITTDSTQWLTQLATQSHCYYPLQLTL